MIFERLSYLFGEEGLKKLNQTCVAVVGLGGVGGIAAISLVRSGVGKIIICDFDVVEESNTNRQIVASSSVIGKYKTNVLEDMIKDINPHCQIVKLTEKFSNNLFTFQPQYIIDAIDDVSAKVALITECLNRNIPFISSMGAAKKIEPDKIELTKLSKTTYDPIAKKLRQHFRNHDFQVVSSKEAVKSEKLGSYMPVVACFGLYLSDYIIKEILRR